MKKVIFLIVILIFNSYGFSEPLIEMDIDPDKSLKDIKSIAIFKFDGKLVNSQREGLIDYLSISHEYYKYLINQFSEKSKIELVDTEKDKKYFEGDSIKAIRSDDVPEYDEKVFVRGKVTTKDTVKTTDVYLYGKINKFYKGKIYDTSYIDITVYLVDSKSKIIYWITGIRGCLKYVTDALISGITESKYDKPSDRDTTKFGWKNPYGVKVKHWALQYRRGYFITMGELGDVTENGWIHNIALNFKLPLWGQLDIVNQIEFSIIPSFQNVDDTNPLRDNTFNTFLPLMFNFIYNPSKALNIEIKNVAPFIKAGLGFSYNKIYYSGLSRYREPDNSFKTVMNFGLGVEYILRLGWINLLGLKLNISQLGFLGEVDYYKWFGSDLSSAGLNLSFGMKYYF